MKTMQLAVLGAVALGLAVAHPQAAHAQTTLDGHYDNTGGFGYDANSGAYTVTPPATFNGNNLVGLLAENAGTTVTVTGGQFDGNGDSGLYSYNGSVVTITGGQFENDGAGLNAEIASVSVYGGVFSGNAEDLRSDSGGNITLYGTFATYGALPSGGASGTFTGTLADESAPQIFSYVNYSTITLAPTPAPEPSSVAAFAFTGLGAAGLMLRARRRKPLTA